MDISECEALEEIIIIHKEEGMTGKTNFSQLKEVYLENLTKLSNVFPSSCKFSSLEAMIIITCPALVTFLEVKDPPDPTTSNSFFRNLVSFSLKF